MGYKLSGTYNHPVLCWTLKNGIPQMKWKLLENIKENDIVILNRGESLFADEDLDLTPYHVKHKKNCMHIFITEIDLELSLCDFFVQIFCKSVYHFIFI